jgi:hypothetical protein
MRIPRLLALTATALTLDACKLAQAPLNMVNTIFRGAGQALHLGSEATKTQDDFKIEAREAHDALAEGATIPLTAAPALRPELARR